METIVKIEWDEPKEQAWLCPENIEIALSAYCVNTKFKVTQINKSKGKTHDVIECGEKLYYDINPNSKMDVPSMFFKRLEKEWDAWYGCNSAVSFYEYCKSQLSVNKS